jgi:hypothetical protein
MSQDRRAALSLLLGCRPGVPSLLSERKVESLDTLVAPHILKCDIPGEANVIQRPTSAERDIDLTGGESPWPKVNPHPVQGFPLALVNRDCPS